MDFLRKVSPWYLAAGILCLVFMFFTPWGLHESFSVYLQILQGLIVGALVFFGIIGLKSFNEVFYISEQEYPKLKDSATILIPAGILVVSAIMFYSVISNRIDTTIKNEGISTYATIVDGSHTTSRSIRRSSSSYKLNIVFSAENRKVVKKEISVSSDVYTSVSKDQKVLVRYLASNPKIFRVIAGDDNIRQFLGIPNRNLRTDDLVKLFNAPKDSIEFYLNKISAPWVTQIDENEVVYVNESKAEAVCKLPDGDIAFRCFGMFDIKKFKKDYQILETTEDTLAGGENMEASKTTGYKTKDFTLYYGLNFGDNGVPVCNVVLKKN